jgi:hypothetical protein
LVACWAAQKVDSLAAGKVAQKAHCLAEWSALMKAVCWGAHSAAERERRWVELMVFPMADKKGVCSAECWASLTVVWLAAYLV